MHLLSVSEAILLFITAFGSVQGILLAFLIYFHSKADKSVNIFLALHIFFISFPGVMMVVRYYVSWHVIIFIQPFLVLIGPLLYLYICSFKEVISWRKTWPHFILFILYLFAAIWFYAAVGSKYPSSVKVPTEIPRHPLFYSMIGIRSIQRIIYFFLSYKALVSYQRSIPHLFSETSRINLDWVRWLIYGYLAVVLVIIGFEMLILKYPGNYSLWGLLIGALVTIYDYLVTFKGIRQVSLWQAYSGIDKKTIEEEMQETQTIGVLPEADEKLKNVKAGLSENKMEEVARDITMLMEREKLYQDTELTLHQLAGRLKVPTYQVSQALNEGMKKNFYDVVNGYRVEEAKRLLLDPASDNYTILSIGFEAGFNSKTAFNTVFKKFTGLTPTDFRVHQKQPVPTT